MTKYNYAFCDNETGNIDSIMTVADVQNFAEGKGPDGRWVILLDRDTNHKEAMEKTYWDVVARSWQSRSAPPTPYYNWTVDKKWVLDSDRIGVDLRIARNQLLSESDWTQMPDSQLSDSKKAEWVTYRQALRDVPANANAELASLNGFVWPTKPS